MDCSLPGPSVHGISPGKNTGVDCFALLQGIFPTLQADSLQLSHQGNPENQLSSPKVCRVESLVLSVHPAASRPVRDARGSSGYFSLEFSSPFLQECHVSPYLASSFILVTISQELPCQFSEKHCGSHGTASSHEVRTGSSHPRTEKLWPWRERAARWGY